MAATADASELPLIRIAMYSTKQDDRTFFREAAARKSSQARFEFKFISAHLDSHTTAVAAGFAVVVPFVNDVLDSATLAQLYAGGTRLIALRCAGFNNVDLGAAAALGIKVVRVPSYSPYAVAEHAMALILTLNRKIHRAYNRVRDGNFSLHGLLGFDLHGRTCGIIGTGNIGEVFCRIAHGMGMRLLAYDVYKNPALKNLVQYVPLPMLLAESDVISLHCPLMPATHHIINSESVKLIKRGAMLINTSRGGLIESRAVIDALKSGQLGSLGIDVYEQESALFFEDLSNTPSTSNPMIQDETFERLISFPNVIVTGHQAFFTSDALTNIADTTLLNITTFALEKRLLNEVPLPKAKL